MLAATLGAVSSRRMVIAASGGSGAMDSRLLANDEVGPCIHPGELEA